MRSLLPIVGMALLALPGHLWAADEGEVMLKSVVKNARAGNQDALAPLKELHDHKLAADAAIPADAVLVPMPSTSGRNVLPDALAWRIAKDYGQTVERRPVGHAIAKTEAKNKRTFFDKINDPVAFVPEPAVLAELQGQRVFITEDVHNTGESWMAFARMLMDNGVDVQGVAVLASTEQRMTSTRDIERLSEKVAGHLGLPLDKVLPVLESAFRGTFKEFVNKAEADITKSAGKARQLYEFAAAAGGAGAYQNPFTNRQESQGPVLGGASLTPPSTPSLLNQIANACGGTFTIPP
jgi:hypothetical protein